MESVRTLVIGAGITGRSTAAFVRDRDVLVLEADAEIGGYCKTVKKAGFTWDYSGHFFHFRHPEIEAWRRARMGTHKVRTVQKRSFIRYADGLIDFPFQKNIHQLPQLEFIECLHDLYFADAQAAARGEAPSAPLGAEASFKEMLYARFGRAIAEKFLVPYMRAPEDASYNATFTYPEGGAFEYVRALASEVPAGAIATGEPAMAVDLQRRVVRTPLREIRYERLISTAPLPRLLQLAGVPHDVSALSWNRVLVLNLGFDRKGQRGVHWIYYPQRDTSFYRVGWYDNIFDTERLSLYVEIGLAREGALDVGVLRSRALEDLRRQQVISDHRLVAEQSVVMDPAYVHITRRSMAEHQRVAAALVEQGVHSVGRYGRWTYCSIEDNIVEARQVLHSLDGATRFESTS